MVRCISISRPARSEEPRPTRTSQAARRRRRARGSPPVSSRTRAGVGASTSRGVRNRLDPRPRPPRGGRFPRRRPCRVARYGSPPIAAMRGSRSDSLRLGSAIWNRSRPRRDHTAKPDRSGVDPRRGVAAAHRIRRSRSISRGRAACEIDLVLIVLWRAPSILRKARSPRPRLPDGPRIGGRRDQGAASRTTRPGRSVTFEPAAAWRR